MKTTNNIFSSREDYEKWIAERFGVNLNPAPQPNHLGAEKQPDPALKPGTIITERCYIVDENGRLWLMDPNDDTIEWLQSPNE